MCQVIIIFLKHFLVMATLVITAGFFKEKKKTMKRAETLYLSHDTEILPNDTGKKNEEKNKFKDVFWFIARLLRNHIGAILSCCIHFLKYQLLLRWITLAASLTEMHVVFLPPRKQLPNIKSLLYCPMKTKLFNLGHDMKGFHTKGQVGCFPA